MTGQLFCKLESIFSSVRDLRGEAVDEFAGVPS